MFSIVEAYHLFTKSTGIGERAIWLRAHVSVPTASQVTVQLHNTVS